MVDTDVLKSRQKSFTAYTEPGYEGNENRLGDALYKMSKDAGMDKIDYSFPKPSPIFPAHMGSQSSSPSKDSD